MIHRLLVLVQRDARLVERQPHVFAAQLAV
jgi:hypothetical protein